MFCRQRRVIRSGQIRGYRSDPWAVNARTVIALRGEAAAGTRTGSNWQAIRGSFALGPCTREGKRHAVREQLSRY
jgi:hypothetical protein